MTAIVPAEDPPSSHRNKKTNRTRIVECEPEPPQRPAPEIDRNRIVFSKVIKQAASRATSAQRVIHF